MHLSCFPSETLLLLMGGLPSCPSHYFTVRSYNHLVPYICIRAISTYNLTFFKNFVHGSFSKKIKGIDYSNLRPYIFKAEQSTWKLTFLFHVQIGFFQIELFS